MTEKESIIFSGRDVPPNLAYVALGHIHKAQSPVGEDHVRYSGSIERLDLGEQHDKKGLTIFEVNGDGRVGDIVPVPLNATPMYDVEIRTPSEDLPRLRERYPDHQHALVRYKLIWTAGVDDRDKILKQIDEIFPRWYERDIREANAIGPSLADPEGPVAQASFQETIRDYVQTELMNHAEVDRAVLLTMLEELLGKIGSGS
jgi:exonuclease SbcD